MTVTTKRAYTAGDHVRRVRVKAEMTLRQLAIATELSESFLSQFERGQTQASISSLRRIADTLQIPLWELFDPTGMSRARVVRPRARIKMPFGEGATKYLVTPQTAQDFAVYVAELRKADRVGRNNTLTARPTNLFWWLEERSGSSWQTPCIFSSQVMALPSEAMCLIGS
jgi:transcriptional regulator with XRE-family HTH domain